MNFSVMLFPGYFMSVQETKSLGARRSTEEKVLLIRGSWDQCGMTLHTWVVMKCKNESRKSRVHERHSVFHQI